MEKEREEKVRALEEKVRALEEGMKEFMKEFDIMDKRMMEQLKEPATERRAVAEILGRILETAKVEESNVQTLENMRKEMIKAALPETFKIGRQGFFRLRRGGCIFGIDKKKLSEKNVTEGDFLAFHLAIYKALSNQSYTSGNQDTHSGISRTKAEKATKLQRDEAEQKAGQETNKKKREALEKAARQSVAYKGDVVVSLHELCKDGYGDTKATTLHKKAMDTVIHLLDTTPITVHYANGDIQGTYVSKIMEFYKGREGTTIFHLCLNPAYTENVARNFGELPQDVMKRLAGSTKKVTSAHKRLLIRLSLQDKKTPFTRTLEELLEEIGMDIETYRKSSSRVEGQIIELCDTMVKAGVAEYYTPTYTTSARGRKQLLKVTFTRETGERRPPRGSKIRGFR